ncbi:hypothetical protein O3M35_012597 [Rhynocoris fuscipes]|uniref:Methionine--tRNA ligase, mitochondrial n=1 Tax=Rhynocoris fuscipes TaxID=488301 RepID=A0AAW1CVF7_9HEMI
MNFLSKKRTLILYCYKHSRQKSDYFITTPIYYVNSAPHIGHLYTSLLADALYRHQLMQGKTSTVFSTGTDEHGTKIQQAATSNNIPLKKFCDKISQEFLKMNKMYDIKSTNFTRTTDLNHRSTVEAFWTKLIEKGHITLGSYEGWYCDADEAFLSDHQISIIKDNQGKDIKVSAESGRSVTWVEETNYKFNLPRFKDDLKYWVNQAKSIQPEKFRKIVLQWIDENGFADEPVSVSRPISRVHWAIPVPGDNTQTIYVWLDALVNYLTVIGYPQVRTWPPDVQIIGKDILKFHALYWPAFLIAADLEPPRSLLVHSHWTVDGEKMSKSKGNIVCPFESLQKYGVNAVRYFLLREGTPHSDSNYSNTKLLRVVNSELADTFGNLLSRCCGKTINPNQRFPSYIEDDFNEYCLESAKDLITLVDSLQDKVSQHYEELNFYKGIALIMQALREANRYFEYNRPWELRKSNETHDVLHLNSLLYLIMETLRVCSIVLMPIVPDLSTKLLNKLNIPLNERNWSNASPTWNIKKSNIISQELNKEKIILFKRIEQ